MKNICIHLYALCFNKQRMLPFFFQHYDDIVDKYFIFDNGSTDGSIETLLNHTKVELKSIQFKGQSFVLGARDFYNSIWKGSKGRADWVIVCNIDEHFHHENLRSYLGKCSKNNYSLIEPMGFEMVSEKFPEFGRPLNQQIKMGVPNTMFNKPQLFRPDLIQEINFAPGRHTAVPHGDVRIPSTPEVKLLHYKYLGEDYFCERLSELRNGLRELDLARNMGHQYKWDEQRKRSNFRSLLAESSQVIEY